LLDESSSNDISAYDMLYKHLRSKFAVTDDDSSAGQLLNTLNTTTIKIVVEAIREWEEIKKTSNK
jgi:hypothetical protein